MRTIKNFEEFRSLNEASLGRALDHLAKHDCAVLTAFRNGPDCGRPDKDEDPEGFKNYVPYTLKENKERNKKLEAQLKKFGYNGYIKVVGTYQENADSADLPKGKKETENSYFVINLNDDVAFLDNIYKLGKAWMQDSVLILESSQKDRAGKVNAYLVSTNKCPKAFPGGGKEMEFHQMGKINPDKMNDFMTRIGTKNFFLS